MSLCGLSADFNCTLPVQIWHFPSERPPVDSPLVKEANELGAELKEAVGAVKDEKRRKNYHLKVCAAAFAALCISS